MTTWGRDPLTKGIRMDLREKAAQYVRRLRGRVPGARSGNGEVVLETARDLHPGGRDEQQDRVEVFESSDGQGCLVVLADGMGGHKGGALAAQRVIEICQSAWTAVDGAPGDAEQFLKELVDRAHSGVNELRQQAGVDARSTMVVAVVRGVKATWVHSGDSRLYLISRGTIVEHTRDHSLVEALVAGGQISAQEAKVHPDRSQLLTSIGGEDPPKRALSAAALEPGDGLFLGSDGVWEHLGDGEIVEAIASDDLHAAIQGCLERATQRGGEKADNASMALVRRLSTG